MIKHIVMFGLKDFAEGNTKEINAQKVKELLKTLPGKIEQIRDYEIGLNEKPSERASDVVLISSFDSWEDLDKYINHPEHKKAVDFILKVREESKVVDYSY